MRWTPEVKPGVSGFNNQRPGLPHVLGGFGL